MTEAVTFNEVSYSYPGATVAALVDASLSIPEGAFVLVTGATGSGKSTLLRSVNGLVPHFTGGRFDGRVTVGGRDTLSAPPRALSDVCAFVPQDPGASFVVDRVEDELAYAMENLGIASATMRRRVEETLDLMDLVDLRNRSVRELSGGERQRVAIAAALTPGARILLLDEPTSQLDPQGAEDVLAALQRLVHDLGMTVLIAEHRLERVAGFVDLAVGCRAGEPPVLGPVGEVLDLIDAGPPVTELGRLLRWSPPPLTVRDARRRIDGSPPPAPETATRPAGEVLLSARGLRAGYGAVPVLAGLDLDLRRGEVVALVGRNGSGKTTLLRCLTGVHDIMDGDISFGGRAPRAGVDVALCPQTPESILFRDTVADEIAATLKAHGRISDLSELLALFGIEHLEGSHPRDLSAGERLLVATAATTATGAPVLLLDEPTRGLDRSVKDRLGRALSDFASGDRAVMLATHDVELVAEIATRVVMLAGGEIIARGTTAEVISDSPVFAPQMTRVFGPGWLTPGQVAEAMVTM